MTDHSASHNKCMARGRDVVDCYYPRCDCEKENRPKQEGAMSADNRTAIEKFYGAQCPSYPDCTGGCGLGCTHEVEGKKSAGNQTSSERIARWMMQRGYATGHGDTIEDMLAELEAQAHERNTTFPADWRSIETAPTGDDDFYLVGTGDPADTRSPFVVRGSILASARKADTPKHLSLGYLTHWMPLPPKPSAKGASQHEGK